MVGSALGSSWTTILAKRILNSAKVPKICVLGLNLQRKVLSTGEC